MAENFPRSLPSDQLDSFTALSSEPSSSESSSTILLEPNEPPQSLYVSDLGIQNHGNNLTSTREPLREINDNNTSLDCGTTIEWGKSLKNMPPFGEKQLDNRLIYNAKTMPDVKAPLAYRHKIQGYKLWKEGYVKKVFSKPDILCGVKRLFMVKANVSASMKQQNYLVYCHLEQLSGEVVFSKCKCKCGEGGVCKHVAALLYQLLDYKNLELKEIPDDVTCTQVLQQWSIPSSSGTTKAVKFEELTFEKADYTRDKENKRKRPLVQGKRDNYCATPPYAKKVQTDEIKALYTSLQRNGKAQLLCKTLLGNNFEPNSTFQSSCTVQKKNQEKSSDSFKRDLLFENMPQLDVQPNISPDTLQKIENKVGVSKDEAVAIEVSTRCQRQSKDWFKERQKRFTSSLFGRVINRRENIAPVSIIASIKKTSSSLSRLNPSLKWGIDNEHVALEMYTSKSGEEVADCGLIINPSWPWLACSPDGIVYRETNPVGAIEIKCPYSKKEMTIEECCKDSSFYLKKNSSGVIALKQSHVYYYQCQGVLNITGLNWIDFIVYTTEDFFIQRIHRDMELWKSKMLPKLTFFYSQYLLD